MNTKRLLVLAALLVALALPGAPSAAGATLNFAAAVNDGTGQPQSAGVSESEGATAAPLSAAPPLGQFLGPDGALNLPPGFQGSLDPRGWALVSEPTAQVRFVAADAAHLPGAAPLGPLGFGHAGSLMLNGAEQSLALAVFDAAGGYAYFGTDTSPGMVVKVRLSDFTAVARSRSTRARTSPRGGDGRGRRLCLLWDAHLAGPSGQGAPVRFHTGAGLALTQARTTLNRRCSTQPAAMPTLGRHHAGQRGQGAPLRFHAGGRPDTQRGRDYLRSAVLDAANGYAYFGTCTAPGLVVKVRLSDFTRVAGLTLNAGENYLRSAVLDAADGYAYFGTHTSPGSCGQGAPVRFHAGGRPDAQRGRRLISARRPSTRPTAMPTLGRTPRRAAWSRCACPISRGWPA